MMGRGPLRQYGGGQQQMREHLKGQEKREQAGQCVEGDYARAVKELSHGHTDVVAAR
jgi:hypothetical protein